MIAFWASLVILIIFLESHLFIRGTSVFGLFSILSLCLAFIQSYFWVVVQSLYCRYDKGEMTREEAFQMKSEKFQGSGAIIRHHNPAYEGIVNSAFVQEVQHQFSNGRTQPIYYLSDTETERNYS